MTFITRTLARLGLGLESPLEIASRELVRAQIDLLAAEAWREQFTGQCTTLRGRITRLRAAVTDLSQGEHA